MVISTTEQVSSGCYKISVSGDLLFFARPEYLKSLKEENLYSGFELAPEHLEELADATLIFQAESKAVSYLARCEQSRYGLTSKLISKGLLKEHIDAALDYLESRNFLNDYRFSLAWLNSRKISHFESRTKLTAELYSRGIGKEDARKALDEFFEDNSEEEFCQKAFEKFVRQKKSGEKLIRSLLNCGFSYNLIKKTIKSEDIDFSDKDMQEM